VEERIARLEAELASLGLRLENPPTDIMIVHKMGSDYARLQAELDPLMEEWAQLHEPVTEN